MSERLQVGSVDFLNARPLVWGLQHGLGAERIELRQLVPSALAESFLAGSLDVALLPAVELARSPDVEIVPGLGIVTRGPALSVRLLTRVPVERVRKVALDPESRTSNALTQILFAEVWGGAPKFAPGPLALAEALADFDAVVRIGDKALFETVPDGVQILDLGETWTQATGLPFVWALWVARSGVIDRERYLWFHDSRRAGSARIEEIAATYSWNGRCDPELATRYLRKHILYRLGSAELSGLELFLRAALRIGLIDRVPDRRLALTRWTECHETAARSAAGE